MAVASVVVVKALDAITSAPKAEPALKPYQPTHSMPVPMAHKTMLCGAMTVLPKPRRLPRMRHSTSALQPEDMWTTVPPAKSIAAILALPLKTPFIRPSKPQTMCASGKYTTNIHKPMNNMMAENFMRSAIAPTMSAGVMMANIN